MRLTSVIGFGHQVLDRPAEAAQDRKLHSIKRSSFETGYRGVTKVRFSLRSSVSLVLALLCGVNGCAPDAPKKIEIPAAYNNLRNLVVAYSQATTSLKHPPANAGEIKPFLEKFGNPKEMLTSTDGTELVIHWGVNLKNLKSQEGKFPIWVYETNPHDGKRWVIQERHPTELTEEAFMNSIFAPGMKKPF
jgi:hypothetical protein